MVENREIHRSTMAEIAGSAVGIISLGIQVCSGIVRYYEFWKDSRKDVATMCQSVESLGKTLEILLVTLNNEDLSETAAKNVSSSIAACKVGIDELNSKLAKVHTFLGTSFQARFLEEGRRLIYPFRASTLHKLREIVSDIRANLELALSVLQL